VFFGSKKIYETPAVFKIKERTEKPLFQHIKDVIKTNFFGRKKLILKFLYKL